MTRLAHILLVVQFYWTSLQAQIVSSIITSALDFSKQGNPIFYGEFQITLVGNQNQIVNFPSVSATPLVNIWIKEFYNELNSNTDTGSLAISVNTITLSSFQVTYQAPGKTIKYNYAYVVLQDVVTQKLKTTSITLASASSSQTVFSDNTLTNIITWGFVSSWNGYYGFQFLYNNVTRLLSFSYGTASPVKQNSIQITMFLFDQTQAIYTYNHLYYSGLLGQFGVPSVTVASYNNSQLLQPVSAFMGLSYFYDQGYMTILNFYLQPPTITDYTEGDAQKLLQFDTVVFALYECITNSVFSNGNCTCNTGYYNATPTKCSKCDYSCLTCSLSTNVTCVTCNSTAFRLFNASTCTCLPGYFDNGTALCSTCDPSCATCTNSTKTDCSTCNSTMFRQPNLTACTCMPGYFDIGTAICQGCHYSCLTCTNTTNTTCLTCNPASFRLINNSTKTCTCLPGYFDNGTKICQACDSTCQTCSDSTITGCLTCNSTTFRQFKINSCTCPPGFQDNKSPICQNSTQMNNSKSCDQTCMTCSNSSKTSCLTCNSTQFRQLKINSCTCLPGYVDSQNGGCQNSSSISTCYYTCQNCTSEAKTSCTTCDPTNFRTFSPTDNTCPCNPGYMDNNQPACIVIGSRKCDVSCLTCSDSTIKGCLTCNGVSPQFRTLSSSNSCICQKQYKVSTNGDCAFVNCSDTQYYDEVYQQCGNCDSTCSTCSGSSLQQCLTCDGPSLRSLVKGQCQCNSGYFSQQNSLKCISQCSDGDYQLGNLCLNCHPLCKTCTGGSPLECSSCLKSDIDEVNTNQNGQQYYQNSNINLILVIKSFVCSGQKSRQLEIKPGDEVTVQISAVNVVTKQDQFDQTFNSLSLIIPKQTFLSGQQYNVSVDVKQQLLTQTIKKSFILQIVKVPKTVTIAGGNMVIGNTKDLIVSCRIFDFDNQDTPTDPKSYTFTWTCNPVNYNILCVNAKGEILDTSSTNQNLTISSQDLAAYNSYQIHVSVFDIAGNDKYNASANYQVVDLNIPELKIKYDPNVLALAVNLNLEQQFQLNYQLKAVNPDDLFYSANLFYNFDIISTIVYQYPLVNFRIWDYFQDFTQALGTQFQFTGQVYNAQYQLPSTFTITMKVNIPPRKCQISVEPNEGEELTDLFLISVENCQSAAFVFTYRFAYYQSQVDYDHDNQYQTLAKASLLTPFQSSNQLNTYLPKSLGGPHIVLVISVQDNLGGISNYTKNVKVDVSTTINENQLIKNIDQITDSAAQLRYLQVISVTLIGSNQTFPNLGPLMTQLLAKANLYPLAQEQKNQALQIQAFTSTQTTNLSSLVLQQQSTSGNLISQIHSTLAYSKQNPSTILNQQTHDAQIIINAQIDSQHILGTMILQNLGSQQNASAAKNSTQSQGMNQQNKHVMDLLNNTRQIKLQQMTINQGTKLLISKFATSAVALATTSKLNDMLGQNIIDDTQTGFLSDQSEESTNDHFSFSYLQFGGNPYSSDEKFPYPDQGFSAIDLQIAKQSKKANISQSPNIAPTKQVALMINQKKSHRMLSSLNNSASNTSSSTNSSNSSNVCLSNVKTKGWTASECQTVTSKGQITCQCNSINPTSVVSDLTGLFAGANTQIFSLSAFGAIAHFQWTKVILFWLIVSITIIYVGSVPLGWRKDNVDLKIKLEMDAKLLSEKQIVGDQQLDPILLEKKESKMFEGQQEEEKLNHNEGDKYEQAEPQQNQKLNLTIQSPNEFNILDALESPVRDDQPNERLPNYVDQKQDEKNDGTQKEDEPPKEVKVEKNFASFLVFLKVLIFHIQPKGTHEMLSIFYSYETLSRPTRSTLIYLTLIMSLAITLYFGSNLSFVRSLILSVLSGIFSTIILMTLKSLLTAKSFLFNIIGIILFMGFAGFFIFVILAVIATADSVKQTNIWAIQYSIQLAYNSTVGALIGIVVKFMLLT